MNIIVKRNLILILEHLIIIKTMRKSFGHLTLIDGPMFADKTTTLIQLIKSYIQSVGVSPKSADITVIKPTTDDRYAVNEIVSHNGLRYPATGCKPDELLDLLGKIAKAIGPLAKLINSKIFIDEGHFFKNLHKAVQTCLEAGIDVVVSGINIDYMGSPFPEMKKLEDIAKTHILCSAYCNECGRLARFTKMRPEIDHPEDSSVVVVGGAEKYAPYCGRNECFAWNS